MWLDSPDWSVAVPLDAPIIYIECLVRGLPVQRLTILRGETENPRGIDINNVSPYDIYVVINERGAKLLEDIGVAVLGVEGRRLWLRGTGSSAAQVFA